MLSHRSLARDVRARSANGTSKLAEGAKVKVVKPVKIYHAPKLPELDLNGMEGTFVKDVTEFKGQTLSANLPIKVAFQMEKDGATVKFQAHLVGPMGVLGPCERHAWMCMQVDAACTHGERSRASGGAAAVDPCA